MRQRGGTELQCVQRIVLLFNKPIVQLIKHPQKLHKTALKVARSRAFILSVTVHLSLTALFIRVKFNLLSNLTKGPLIMIWFTRKKIWLLRVICV